MTKTLTSPEYPYDFTEGIPTNIIGKYILSNSKGHKLRIPIDFESHFYFPCLVRKYYFQSIFFLSVDICS